jgi:hypothetical protein
MPAYPDSAAKPGRGWWWSILALLLSMGAFVPAAAPVAAPAAVVARPGPPPTTAPDPPRVPGLWMPAAGAVVRGFDARAGPYGAGHRGIDIAAPMGELVRAPAAGRVVFAGPVAGTTWVSVRVAPGVLATSDRCPTRPSEQVRCERGARSGGSARAMGRPCTWACGWTGCTSTRCPTCSTGQGHAWLRCCRLEDFRHPERADQG